MCRFDMTIAPWPRLPEPEPEELYGENAVLQIGPGRRSRNFPKLNIGATAEKLGVTKSHLAKVLEGISRPSVELAVKVAEMLGKDLNFVVRLYKQK